MIKYENKKMNKGFTLVELLIVVLVISVLSGVTLGVLNSKGVKAKSRDAQREADLRKIQTALELFFVDNRQYPTTSGSWIKITGTDTQLSDPLEPDYMNVVPVDPVNDGDADVCNGPTQYSYNYHSPVGGGTYFLATVMEVESSISSSPCVDLLNWSTVCSAGANDTSGVCFGVQNP